MTCSFVAPCDLETMKALVILTASYREALEPIYSCQGVVCTCTSVSRPHFLPIFLASRTLRVPDVCASEMLDMAGGAVDFSMSAGEWLDAYSDQVG